MLFSKNESIEERCMRYLLARSMTVHDIAGELDREQVTVSIQAIYKALRALAAGEIVIKHATRYSLSEEWRVQALHAMTSAQNTFALAEGERISFNLQSLVHLDQQWKNIILPLQEADPEQPTFLYNQHTLWMYISPSRKESERLYYASFSKNKSHAFFAIGGATPHDIVTKKELSNEYVHVNTGTEYFKNTEHPTIFGDYIIMVRFSTGLAQKIQTCYMESPDTETLEKSLQAIGIEKKKITLIIERDRAKAKKFRKKIGQDFAVPRELVEKFGLY